MCFAWEPIEPVNEVSVADETPQQVGERLANEFKITGDEIPDLTVSILKDIVSEMAAYGPIVAKEIQLLLGSQLGLQPGVAMLLTTRTINSLFNNGHIDVGRNGAIIVNDAGASAYQIKNNNRIKVDEVLLIHEQLRLEVARNGGEKEIYAGTMHASMENRLGKNKTPTWQKTRGYIYVLTKLANAKYTQCYFTPKAVIAKLPAPV